MTGLEKSEYLDIHVCCNNRWISNMKKIHKTKIGVRSIFFFSFCKQYYYGDRLSTLARSLKSMHGAATVSSQFMHTNTLVRLVVFLILKFLFHTNH